MVFLLITGKVGDLGYPASLWEHSEETEVFSLPN